MGEEKITKEFTISQMYPAKPFAIDDAFTENLYTNSNVDENGGSVTKYENEKRQYYLNSVF